MTIRRNAFALFLAIFSIGSQSAFSADIVWTAPSDGDFGDAAKWTPLQVPSVNDTAVFNTAGTYTVTFDHTPYPLANPVANDRLAVAQGTVTFASGADGKYLYQLNNATLGSPAGAAAFNLGNNGAPVNMNVGNELIVQDGAVANVLFGSALNAGKVSIGTLSTDGGGTLIIDSGLSNGTQMNVSGTTTVGSYGTSTMTFRNGATGSLNRVEVGIQNTSGAASSTSTLNVNSDADLTLGDLVIGSATSGAAANVSLTGAGTTVKQFGNSSLAIGDANKTLGSSLLNIGSGALYEMQTGVTNLPGKGWISVTGGTFRTAGDVNANPNGDPNTLGSNIDVMSGLFAQTGATNLTVGAPSGGPGYMSVSSQGTLSTGTGLFTINKTGNVTVAGTLLANGDVLVNGGLLQRTSATSTSFVLAPGRKFTIQNGGRATFTGSFTTGVNGIYSITGGNSKLDANSGITIGAGASINVTAGGTLSTVSNLNVATTFDNVAGNGTLVVDGAGSLASGSSGTWATSSGTAQVTIRNSGIVTLNNSLNLATNASSTQPPTVAIVSVESGGKLFAGSVMMANSGVASTTAATLTITGAGSAVNITPSGLLTVGGPSIGSATINVNDHGSLTVGSSTSIGANGTININGGVVDLKSTNKTTGGKINFTSGSLSMNTSLTVGSNGLLGDSLALTPDKILSIGTGSLTVSVGSLVTLQDGASFAPFNVNNSGEIDFNGASNTFTTTQGITNGGIIRGNARMVSGLTNAAAGQISVGPGQRLQFTKISSNSGRIDTIGTESSRAELDFDAPLSNLSSSGLITGRSAVMRFPNSGTTVGMLNQGALTLTGGTNDVFGDISSTGSIVVTGGASATFYDDITNNGTLQVSKVGNTSSTAIFLGSFTGAGSTSGGGDIFFEGDLRPGNSPASVNYNNNVNFGAASKLQIELGGTTAGTQYDQVHVGGALTLGGALQVSLINSFSPALGNSFHVLDWQQRTGTFATLDLPGLSTPLAWSTNQLYSAGSLSIISVLPGDFNQDGALTGADISAMLSALTNRAAYESAKGFSDAQFLTLGDFDHSGEVTNADIQPLLAAIASAENGGGSALASVPEPSSLAILFLGMLTVSPRIRSRWRR
jgi:hypothetical protein